jgi:hypothetical protein
VKVTLFSFSECEFSIANHPRRYLKPKTKNRETTDATSAHLTLEGVGDTFWF